VGKTHAHPALAAIQRANKPLANYLIQKQSVSLYETFPAGKVFGGSSYQPQKCKSPQHTFPAGKSVPPNLRPISFKEIV